MTSKEINQELDILRPRLKRLTGEEYVKVAERINELNKRLSQMEQTDTDTELDKDCNEYRDRFNRF